MNFLFELPASHAVIPVQSDAIAIHDMQSVLGDNLPDPPKPPPGK